MSTIYATKSDDVPKGKHYVVIRFTQIWIPGDERSRQAPGHGYPERFEDKCQYKAYLDEAEWKLEVARMTHSNDNFVAFVVEKLAKIKQQVEVVIE
jgi:hypothetical protein